MSIRRSLIAFSPAGLLLLLLACPAAAQKAPELGYVYPPAIGAGKSAPVLLGGYDFTPDMQFFVHDERADLKVLSEPGPFLVPRPPYWFGPKGRTAALPISREVQARLSAAPDMPPGLVRWQVANANGSSATAVFYVSDVEEIVERRYRDEPQPLPRLPIGVSGRLERIAEVDRYEFTAPRDGPVTIQLQTRQLGANFNGGLQVRDGAGRVIADVADTEGRDVAVTIAARRSERYQAALRDIDFRGHPSFVYRLQLTPGPRVLTTIPAAGQRGTAAELEFVGYGVASGGAALESVRRRVEFPADSGRAHLRYQLQTPWGAAPAIRIPLSDLPERVAAAGASGGPIEAPCAVTGRLAAAEHELAFTASQGQVWSLALQSQAIGARLDLSLSVLDSAGQTLAANDDLAGTPDAGLQLTAPQDGVYRCLIRDLSGRELGAASVYRLALQRPPPDFSLSAPQQVNIQSGAQAQLEVKAERRGGFDGDVDLQLQGLPSSIQVADGFELKLAAGSSSIKIPLQAASDAPWQASVIRVVATASIDDEKQSRVAAAPAAGNLCPRDPAGQVVTQLLLATVGKPPLAVELVDKNRQRAVHRGTTYPAEFLIKRQDGFRGQVLLQMAARQSRHRQGISGPVLEVAPDAERALYPCFLPEWLETDRTTRMTVLGLARVADPQGAPRWLAAPANSRVTMILEGALLKVSQRAGELTVRRGEAFQVPVEVARSAKLPAEVEVELIVPAELQGLVEAAPVTLAAEQGRGVLQVRTAADAHLTGLWTLQVRATALQDQRWPAVSQDELPVEFVAGAAGGEGS